ncbi:hypothetical protein SAMN05421663_101652 [Terribacillus halophilus]|uniref:Uncharacterized protein n=1 Tax=Terribacillus halophilus TaxID=361279 RepID=A0A1G6JP13_9BACI|nr:hypothetical protein SAMN05421663_101652 [Terribacillus halophilus]
MAPVFCFVSSPIQTFTVGPGLAPDQPQNKRPAGHGLQQQLATVTVGRELHPAPKIESI